MAARESATREINKFALIALSISATDAISLTALTSNLKKKKSASAATSARLSSASAVTKRKLLKESNARHVLFGVAKLVLESCSLSSVKGASFFFVRIDVSGRTVQIAFLSPSR